MGVHIYCDSKDILDAKNTTFYLLHESINSIIEEKKIEMSSELNAMLERTDQNIYGPGGIGLVDIADYIKTKKDLLLFADLVKEGIEKEYKRAPFTDEILESLWNFHKELLKYGEKL